jgi:hypothetical protein
MTLTASGNLIVGTTSDNGARLQVSGAATFSGALNGTSASFTTTGNQLTINGSGNSSPASIRMNGTTSTGANYDTAIFQADAITGGSTPVLNIQTVNAAGTAFVTALSINTSQAATFSSSVTASSFIRSGGTSSQYLMADGSVSTLSNPVTGTGTTNYLPKFTGSTTIGNSLVFDNGTNVGIGTSNPTNKLTIQSNSTQLRLETASDPSNYYSFIESNYNAANPLNIYSSAAASYAFGTIALAGISGVNTYVNSYYGLVFGTGSSLISSGTVRGMVTQGGNWLIGTTSDNGARLQVSSSAEVPVNVTSSAAASTFVLDNTNANLWGGVYAVRVNGSDKHYFGTLGSLVGSTNYDATIWSTSGNGFRVYTNGVNSPRLIVDTTGAATFSSSVTATQFITGGTPSNTAGFTNSFYAESNVPSLTLSNTGVNTGKYTIGVTNGSLGIWNNATSTYPLFINSSNNVGIGTVSPNEKLHCAGNIHAYAPGGIDAGLFASSAAGSTTVAIRSIGITHFNGGNVLIGTSTNGASKLRIVGLPTSSAGLSSGDVWNDGGTLKIA